MLKSFRHIAVIGALLLPLQSLGQAPDAVAQAPVPTTHILAIGRFTRPLTSQEMNSILPHEVPDTLRLILAGKIDQAWVRQDRNGVIFLMNVTTVKEAHAVLEKLPLGQAKLMEFDLMPVGPLGPLRILLTDTPPATK
jgi:hypothetical protein